MLFACQIVEEISTPLPVLDLNNFISGGTKEYLDWKLSLIKRLVRMNHFPVGEFGLKLTELDIRYAQSLFVVSCAFHCRYLGNV